MTKPYREIGKLRIAHRNDPYCKAVYLYWAKGTTQYAGYWGYMFFSIGLGFDLSRVDVFGNLFGWRLKHKRLPTLRWKYGAGWLRSRLYSMQQALFFRICYGRWHWQKEA